MGPCSGRWWTLLFLGLALAGCGDDDKPLPASCTEGADTIEAALRSAPGAVRIDGVRLSTCMARARDAGELQALGAGLVGAAADLSAAARRSSQGSADLRLGYLMGAVRRGAGHAGGERTELLRRLDQEAGAVGGNRDDYRRGLRAGRRTG